jgi:hypothetical protein
MCADDPLAVSADPFDRELDGVSLEFDWNIREPKLMVIDPRQYRDFGSHGLVSIGNKLATIETMPLKH